MFPRHFTYGVSVALRAHAMICPHERQMEQLVATLRSESQMRESHLRD